MNESAFLRALEKRYGIEAVSLDSVEGGFDPNAWAYSVMDIRSRRFFVKFKPQETPAIALAAYLNDQGINEVVCPIRASHGELAIEIDGGFCLVYPFLDGANGFETPLNSAQWRRFGEAVRRVHETELPRSILPKLRFEDFRRRETDQIVELGQMKPGDEIGQKVLSVFESKEEELTAMLARFESLGDALRSQKFKFVPCHADLHVGNVLALANDSIAIVDWDAPRFAPAECDLMFMRDGGILSRHGIEEEAAFFSGYGDVEMKERLFKFYRLARTIEDVAAFSIEALDLEATEDARIKALDWLKRQFQDFKN